MRKLRAIPKESTRRITLTPEEELYCKRISEGARKREAYLEAFGSCGDPKTDSDLWNKIDRRVPVQIRIKDLIEQKNKMEARAAEIAGSALAVDKFWVMNELVKNIESAKLAKEFSTVNRSLELIGKELGMFIDRSKLEIEKKQSLDEFLDTLDLPPSEFKRIEDKTLQ